MADLPRRPATGPGVEPVDEQRDAARDRLDQWAETRDPCLECDGEGCGTCDGTGDAPSSNRPNYRAVARGKGDP